MTSILAIEDDPSIRAALERGLVERGHTVQTAGTGIAGLEAVLGEHPDVVLLDLGLPDVDGITVIGMIRAASSVPIIVLTAVDDDPTMVRALDSGADDYVVKPFHYQELRARIGAVLRRGAGSGEGPCRAGEIVVDPVRRKVWVGEREVALSNKEFALLRVLIGDPSRVFSKRELLEAVWGYRAPARTRTLDSHASRLRRKLDPEHGRYVVNAWGFGYRLVDG
jgi:two-component system, OmpR family, KDP operon response regulator KdpE